LPEIKHFICRTCGKKVETGEAKPPCEVLKGWVMATQWKDFESVNQYVFCSFSCLKRWVDPKVPNVPDVFIKSFVEDEDQNK